MPAASRAHRGPSAATVFLLVASSACARDGLFAPTGLESQRVNGLLWLLTGLGAACYLVVVALLIGPRGRRGGVRRSDRGLERRYVIGGGVVLPSLVLGVVLLANLQTLAATPTGGELTVEVVGHQFWWEVRYPEQGIVTANELHIPVGTPVRLELRSADVVHSFWVPRLAGKRDLIPGRTTRLTVQAQSAGAYRGACAEFCGIQHANMAVLVIAEEPSAFRRWVAAAQAPASAPATAAARRGQEVFLGSGCASCHTVRGTPADGRVGPDLTHFAERLTIGAGAAPNDRGHLGGWVVDAQSLKPGSGMPPVPVPPDGLQDLLTYLEGLR